MPKLLYNPKTKAAIVKAASGARAKGKTWAGAFEAAKKVGYKGSLQGIEKMMKAVARKAKKAAGKRRGRKPGRKPGPKAARIARRGPGRPPKSASGVGGIEAMVSELVASRVKAVLDMAIAALEETQERYGDAQ